MDLAKKILELIPHAKPFRFVDEFLSVSGEEATGTYTFREDEVFYAGHFPGNAITPGVILVETMVQIGLLGIGIAHCIENVEAGDLAHVVLSSTDVNFVAPVYPGEKVTVKAEKIYLRFGKLKCKAKMFNDENQVVCKGELSGMLLMKDQQKPGSTS